MPKLSDQRTAQSRWAARQLAAGNCRICGKPRNRYKWLCDTHQSTTTAYMRRWRANRRAKAKALAEAHASTSATTV